MNSPDTFYRHRDWRGSVTMVTDGKMNLVQHTGYYPYGEPWREPLGQPYLFEGKERMRDCGLNEYDFTVRRLYSPLCIWNAPDKKALQYSSTNPFVYCAGNPLKYIDPDGSVVIFINGMHNGSEGGKAQYWNGLDQRVMSRLGDFKARYYDGSSGGVLNLVFGSIFNRNIYSGNRYRAGYFSGYKNAEKIISSLSDDETIKIVTHSMGGMFGKGFILGLQQYAKENDIDKSNLIEIEVDLAPFQPYSQKANPKVKTITISHEGDWLAGTKPIEGADNNITRKGKSKSLDEHYVDSFSQDEIDEIIPKLDITENQKDSTKK